MTAPTSEKSAPEVYAPGYVPEVVYSEVRTPCRDRDPLKQAMFGDLHIHTALSGDAYADGTRVFPVDALRFARGEAIDLPAVAGQAPRQVQLTRPLDFAAVTDHSEALGEGHICRTPGAYPGYDSRACKVFRRGKDPGVRVFGVPRAGTRPRRVASVCGKDSADCEAAARIVWQNLIETTEAAYDRSGDCAFTSFLGYEYTRSPSGMHMHRNTIFKNASVPDYPGNYIDYPTLPSLLEKLENECRLGLEACDVLSIPHNSNLSSGNGFNPRSLEGFSPEDQEAHRLQRQSYDRIMELTQHKGTSECVNGVTDILGDQDEYCDIEAIRSLGRRVRAFDITVWIPRLYRQTLRECTDSDLDPRDNLYKGPCLSSRDFARGAWLEGLLEAEHGHTNPFKMGVIGSTDTHTGTGGNTAEADWPGHIAHEITLAGRLGRPGLGRHNRIEGNPGGLAGVWAVENSRDAIFQSLKRRETFATSGTRIEPRFFAGAFDDDLCGSDDWLATAYEKGVPMGAEIASHVLPGRFILQARRDSDPRAASLERLQIIKGWLDEQNQKRVLVTDVAVARRGGTDEMCAVYEDPDFDPERPAFYYLRAIEAPVRRWSSAQCISVDPENRPLVCQNLPEALVNEMAWTSPIWFTPESAAQTQ
ncbi:MAG: DUF3604 domain-containing protein [Pseudomonadota bacterium]